MVQNKKKIKILAKKSFFIQNIAKFYSICIIYQPWHCSILCIYILVFPLGSPILSITFATLSVVRYLLASIGIVVIARTFHSYDKPKQNLRSCSPASFSSNRHDNKYVRNSGDCCRRETGKRQPSNHPKNHPSKKEKKARTLKLRVVAARQDESGPMGGRK